ncbi:MAG: hypothetical protein COS73_06730 [Nitrospirae bacterium CG06_land_8_20_14_3_00_70_43]|nr:MAG: hypothetical protein COS73_06730 [Nitrospirae bacterium CG06_land_8_20_14_3_00_70_43]
MAIVVVMAAGCAPRPWMRPLPSTSAYGVQFPEGEAAHRLREDTGADRHLRAAAWLHGALAYLPPALPTPAPEARSCLVQASELEPQAGGAGEVARTLLGLLTSYESERDAQQAAARSATKAAAAQARLKKQLLSLEHEMERLKAIDLAPLPAEESHE